MKRIISSPLAPKAVGPYSQGVEINNTLYMSGQIPIDPSTGNIVEGGIKEQTQQVLKNIGAVLNAAGYDYRNVVKSTVFLQTMDDFKAMNEVYAGFYPVDPPARSTFAVKTLPMNVLVEIETIAVKG